MILDLPPNIEKMIIQEAHDQDMSVNDYVIAKLFDIKPSTKPKSIADLVQGKHLQGFNDDPVVIQRVLRDE